MRNLFLLDIYRDKSPEVFRHFGNAGDDKGGAFLVLSCTDQQPMRVIASSGEGWDHVSVSCRKRCPNWHEMEQVKRLFFKEDETVMQLHVPPSDHINVHSNCLHLWRPHIGQIPRPPSWMVG